MSKPDLNLLFALDVLLAEGSVAAAARKLRLSPSAMSRTLSRLRETTGDPLLVRAGRGLVPTPRALELRARVSRVVQDGEALLGPGEKLDLTQLSRTFSLLCSEGFVENFGAGLIARAAREAPGVRLRFVQKSGQDGPSLADGGIDLETGVVGKATSPDLRTRALFKDRFIGVVRRGHALARGKVTPARYAAAQHVLVTRRGQDRGPIDVALATVGLERDIATLVGGFATALALARDSDLVASVPERHTGKLRRGMHDFELPIRMPDILVSMLWHPRLDADAAHRWLRDLVREACDAPR